MREGESFQTSYTDNGKLPLTDVVDEEASLTDIVEVEFDRYGINDLTRRRAPDVVEQVFEHQEVKEQIIVDEPHIFTSDDRDRLESSTRRSSNRANRAPVMYDEWTDSSIM